MATKTRKKPVKKPAKPAADPLPLRLEWRTPKELDDNPANWREHPEAQTVALRDLIGEVGWAGALLYNERTKRLIDGHARKKVTSGPVPVLIGSWSEADERKILATLDPLAAMATANAEALKALLAGVETGSDAVKAMLVGLGEEHGLDAAVEPGAGGDEFDVEAAAEGPCRVKPGELWVIGGKHRLLCGDSTKAEDVARVMGGERADVCITSPPFNLGNSHHTADRDTQAYPDEKDEQVYQVEQVALLEMLARILRGDCFYQHKNRIKKKVHISPLAWVEQGPWRIVQEVVWINGGPNMDPCRFYPQTERVYWLTKDGSETRFQNAEHLTDWWQVAPVGSQGEHTRAYPVDLPRRLLVASGADSVFDPYLGSGTTIIAAHRTNRRCFGLEIEPRYCEVILKRCEAEGLEVERGD